MRAGRLRHRIRIQENRATGKSATGAKLEDWQDVAEVWAAVEGVSGREFLRGATQLADLTHTVTIRYRAGIRPHMRIRWGDQVLDIDRPPIDPEGRRRELQLLCKEVVR